MHCGQKRKLEGRVLPAGEGVTEEEEGRPLPRKGSGRCKERVSPRRRGGHCKGRLSLSGAENCGWVFSPKTDEAKHWIASHIARPTSLLLLLQISISPPFVFCHTQACLLPLIKVSILPRQKSNKYWVLVFDSPLIHTILQSAPGHIVHSCNPQQAYPTHPLQL